MHFLTTNITKKNKHLFPLVGMLPHHRRNNCPLEAVRGDPSWRSSERMFDPSDSSVHTNAPHHTQWVNPAGYGSTMLNKASASAPLLENVSDMLKTVNSDDDGQLSPFLSLQLSNCAVHETVVLV